MAGASIPVIALPTFGRPGPELGYLLGMGVYMQNAVLD